MGWRWALASRIGTSHIRMGTRKQDALKTFTLLGRDAKEILCAIVSDGAGSSQYGGEGASLTCRLISQAVHNHFLNNNLLPCSEDLQSWIDAIRDKLALVAINRGVSRKSFACTLVLLVSREDQNIIAHVGDGAIVGRDQEGVWQTLSEPENGEYASSTYFLTDDPTPRIRFYKCHKQYTAYSLFSDGIENLALNQQSLTPHAPFFAGMIRPLDEVVGKGKDIELSKALAAFLDSDRVCERTDDDKSLILLSAA